MNWQSYFNQTFIINLPKRYDRRDTICEQFNEYGISAFIYDAIEDEKGYRGLLLTMKKLFKECLEQGLERILVFEDDSKIVVPHGAFHDTMNACVEQLQKLKWDCFYLGLQHPIQFSQFVAMNLLPVCCGYSTHAVAYSRYAMEVFVTREFDEPIDNWFVREFQPYRTSYCSYPLLCTQHDGFSDIGQSHCTWDVYISPIFEQSVLPALHSRSKFNT